MLWRLLVMRMPYIEAKDKDTGYWYRGFYFAFPYTTHCISEDYTGKNKVKINHCLVTHRMGDWGLPNEPQLVFPIDTSTIKILGYVDTDEEFYIPNEWVKE